MPLDSYAGLQSTVLQWLGRPGDPAVAPFVADMVRLAEAEASRRLRVVDAERVQLGLPVAAGSNLILPGDCWQVRRAYWGGVQLEFLAPGDPVFNAAAGVPRYYTLLGVNTGGNAGETGLWGEFVLVLGPSPSQDGSVDLVYQVGVPPLSEARPTNWLLALHPDAYLFATLVEAELFVGNDERGPLWLQRRDAAFASIEAYDRKARWSGPLQIRPDIMGLGGGAGTGGGSAGAPPAGGRDAVVTMGESPPAGAVPGDLWFDSVSAQLFVLFNDGSSTQWVPAINQATGTATPAGLVTVLAPASGSTVTLPWAGSYYVNNAAVLPALTIVLPPGPATEPIEIGFAHPVTALTMPNASAAPANAYGPGAALQFQYVGSGWVYWK